MSIKKILASITKADLEFNLIENEDNICVGVSGGKDSMLMIKALKIYQNYPFKNFNFHAVFLDLGFGNVDTKTLQSFCDDSNVDLHIVNATEVCSILNQHRSSTGNLPCSICSRMKKASINEKAHELNCNKVAFAHHFDDALETMLMNMIYGGRIATFAPKMYLSETKLTFIRPFIFTREKDIISVCKKEKIPVIKSPCPNDHITMREEAKNMLNYIYKTYPSSFDNFKTMMIDSSHFDMWFNKKEFPLDKDFTIKEASTKKDYFDILLIRKEVFVNELNVPYDEEFVEEDKNDNVHHFIIRERGKACATISYINDDNYSFHLRRFAIKKEYRRRKLGSKIVRFIESIISMKNNPCRLYFNAMEYVKEFYEKLGYIPLDYNIEAGIPHVYMEKIMKHSFKYKLDSI